MSYDALVITAHPDDAETQMGGTLAKLAEGGQRILLVDLTEGEPSDFAPRGERARQAAEAARILGVERLTLGHQDRFLADDQGLRLEVAALIREHRPRTVAKWVIGLLLLMMGARLLIFVLAAAGLINWGGFTGTSWLWIMPVLMVLMMGLMFFRDATRDRDPARVCGLAHGSGGPADPARAAGGCGHLRARDGQRQDGTLPAAPSP
jgi:hypothetical protein